MKTIHYAFLLILSICLLSSAAAQSPLPFGGTQFRGINVTFGAYSTDSNSSGPNFPALFKTLSESWGVHGIRLVLQTDPNRVSPSSLIPPASPTLQHDCFWKWLSTSGSAYTNGTAGVWDNGDRLGIDSTGFNKLMTVLGQAQSENIKVILDIHSMPGQSNYDFWSCSDPYNITNTNSPQALADQKGIYFQVQSRFFWTTLIETYLKANPNLIDTIVGYDLMNEPDLITSMPEAGFTPTSGTTRTFYMNALASGSFGSVIPSMWKNYSNHNLNYNRLMYYTIGAIRTAEGQLTSNLGLSSTVCKTAIVEGWGSYGNPGNLAWLQPVSDPMNNTIYSFHMYIPHYFTDYTRIETGGYHSYYPSYRSKGDQQNFGQINTEAAMSVVGSFLSNNGLSGNQMFVGELGTEYGTDDLGADVWTWDVLNFCSAPQPPAPSQPWHWAWWSYSGDRDPELDYTGYTPATGTSYRLPVLEAFWQSIPISRPAEPR
jgi:aryl-phospho-beta-D-glucosidase BglC (GH1 family)